MREQIDEREAFTPGPWRFYKNKLRPQHPVIIREVQTKDGRAIVHWGGFDSCDLPKKEIEANARLMASAPDLYEIARRLVKTFGETPTDELLLQIAEDSSTLTDIVNQARVAINKATVSR